MKKKQNKQNKQDKLEKFLALARYDYRTAALAYNQTGVGTYGHKYHMFCPKCRAYLGWFTSGNRFDWACALAKGENLRHQNNKLLCNPNPPLYQKLHATYVKYASLWTEINHPWLKHAVKYWSAYLQQDESLKIWRMLAAQAKVKYY